MNPPTDKQTLTIVVKWLVIPGREAEFEAWLRGINAEAMQMVGHLGVDVIRPAEHQNPEYVLIFRYDSYEHLREWQESPARAQWLEKAKAFTQKEAEYQTYSGLEYWFSLPQNPQVLPPNRWKMAALTWLAIFPLVYTLPTLLGGLLLSFPLLVRTIIVTVVMVLLMTFVVMPYVTRLFAWWLFPRPKPVQTKNSP